MHDVPYGFCHCGCGQKTNLATRTVPARGWVKGKPYRYVGAHVHAHRGPQYVEEDHGYKTPCHIWQLYRLKNGYGLHGKKLAHRLAWERENGPIPEGLWVCHRCDVPSCVNVDHLFLGTPSDNQYDCVAKGRRISGRGEDHGQARLTWAAVAEIRASTDRPVDLACRYGVSPNTIHAVLKRRSWNHEPQGDS